MHYKITCRRSNNKRKGYERFCCVGLASIESINLYDRAKVLVFNELMFFFLFTFITLFFPNNLLQVSIQYVWWIESCFLIMRNSDSQFLVAFHRINVTWRSIMMINDMIDDDDKWRRSIMIFNDDDQCWWSMMMIYDDDDQCWWWSMMMINDDDKWRWSMMVINDSDQCELLPTIEFFALQPYSTH